jgi:hypothetical protein
MIQRRSYIFVLQIIVFRNIEALKMNQKGKYVKSVYIFRKLVLSEDFHSLVILTYLYINFDGIFQTNFIDYTNQLLMIVSKQNSPQKKVIFQIFIDF